MSLFSMNMHVVILYVFNKYVVIVYFVFVPHVIIQKWL